MMGTAGAFIIPFVIGCLAGAAAAAIAAAEKIAEAWEYAEEAGRAAQKPVDVIYADLSIEEPKEEGYEDQD